MRSTLSKCRPTTENPLLPLVFIGLSGWQPAKRSPSSRFIRSTRDHCLIHFFLLPSSSFFFLLLHADTNWKLIEARRKEKFRFKNRWSIPPPLLGIGWGGKIGESVPREQALVTRGQWTEWFILSVPEAVRETVWFWNGVRTASIARSGRRELCTKERQHEPAMHPRIPLSRCAGLSRPTHNYQTLEGTPTATDQLV